MRIVQVGAAGLFARSWVEGGQQHLLADGIHLLADDPLHLETGALTEGGIA